MVVILVFGDSISYGAWDKEGGWVQRLRKYLDGKQLRDSKLWYLVYNMGVSGDTSEDLLERIEYETKQRTGGIEGEEVVILISIGVNDSLIDASGKNGVSLGKFSVNLGETIQLARKHADRVIFVGNTPVDESKVDPMPWLGGCSYKNSEIEKYELRAREICGKEKIEFVEIYNMFKKNKNYARLLGDRVHPMDEGHEFIFERVREFLTGEKII